MRRKCTTHTYLCAFALYQSSISLSLLRTLHRATVTLFFASLSPDFASSMSEEEGGGKGRGKGERHKGGRRKGLLIHKTPRAAYPLTLCVFVSIAKSQV